MATQNNARSATHNEQAHRTAATARSLDSARLARALAVEKAQHSPHHGKRTGPLTSTASLAHEGITFAQLTRPSRSQLFHHLTAALRAKVDGGRALLFLVRPIKQTLHLDASPETLTTAMLHWALEQLGFEHGGVSRLDGPVVEYLVQLDMCKAVRNLPRREDPLLRLDAGKARKKFGRAVSPLLFERIDGASVAPSKLLYLANCRPSSPNPTTSLPHYPLHRNATHANKRKRVVQQVLDSRFNPIPFEGRLSKKRKLAFAKCALLRRRDADENTAIDIGMRGCFANVVLDWALIRETGAERDLEGRPLGCIDILDPLPSDDDDGEPVVRTFFKHYCPDACFAESDICHVDGRCRFLRWNDAAFPAMQTLVPAR